MSLLRKSSSATSQLLKRLNDFSQDPARFESQPAVARLKNYWPLSGR
jgi:hypothetical protein